MYFTYHIKNYAKLQIQVQILYFKNTLIFVFWHWQELYQSTTVQQVVRIDLPCILLELSLQYFGQWKVSTEHVLITLESSYSSSSNILKHV